VESVAHFGSGQKILGDATILGGNPGGQLGGITGFTYRLGKTTDVATAPIESIAFVLEMSFLRFGETPQLARQDLLGISFGAPKLRTESSERRTVKICQDM
jgi:hypothetical protein